MKKNHIIIIVLIGIICLLGVGFAAFGTVLNINGTSTISSEWNIQITNIISKNAKGSAANFSSPVFTDTSATFKTTLVSPGDSMTYEVTVENRGTIDAKVDKITMTDSKNPAITFETSGINENDLLEAGESQKFNVVVSYSDSVTTQPSKLESSLTVKLDYVQNK